MADFCKQCSIDNFGEDFRDLADLSSESDTNGLFCLVICEGCGVVQVDHEGKCISVDCYEKHGLVYNAKENHA